jgi:hypothetical protein
VVARVGDDFAIYKRDSVEKLVSSNDELTSTSITEEDCSGSQDIR